MKEESNYKQDEQSELVVSTENSTESDNSGGMDDHIAGFLCYLVGFITGIIFLFVKPESQFVRFHAWQSIIVAIIVSVLSVFVIIVDFVLAYIPLIGWLFGLLLSGLFGLATFALWIFLMIQAYQGKEFNVPIAGQIARNLSNK